MPHHHGGCFGCQNRQISSNWNCWGCCYLDGDWSLSSLNNSDSNRIPLQTPASTEETVSEDKPLDQVIHETYSGAVRGHRRVFAYHGTYYHTIVNSNMDGQLRLVINKIRRDASKDHQIINLLVGIPVVLKAMGYGSLTVNIENREFNVEAFIKDAWDAVYKYTKRGESVCIDLNTLKLEIRAKSMEIALAATIVNTNTITAEDFEKKHRRKKRPKRKLRLK